MKKQILIDDFKEIIQLILNLFAEKTKHAIAYYDEEGSSNWCSQQDSFSPLCSYINLGANEELKILCEIDHRNRSSESFFAQKNSPIIKKCHFGLKNLSKPIYLDEKFKGALLTGQKRPEELYDSIDSVDIFNAETKRLLDEKIINENEKQKLWDKFNETKFIRNFDVEFVESIIEIEKKLIKLSSSLEKQLQERKNRFDLIRHELHKPNYYAKHSLRRLINELNVLFSKINTSIDESRTYQNIAKQLNNCCSQLSQFSNIIENISESFSSSSIIIINATKNDLIRIITTAIEIYKTDAELKGISINEIEIQKGLEKKILIECDESLLLRAFTNVYQNAVKYSFYGFYNKEESYFSERFVSTKIFEKNYKLFITISNFGLGIKEEELTSGVIWKEGVRGLLSQDRERIGSGLGLTQIKKIIEAHGGKVQLTSVPHSPDLINGPYLTTITIILNYFVN